MNARRRKKAKKKAWSNMLKKDIKNTIKSMHVYFGHLQNDYERGAGDKILGRY